MATRQQLVMATVSLTVVGWLGTVEVHGEDGAATFVLSGVSFHFCKILSLLTREFLFRSNILPLPVSLVH